MTTPNALTGMRQASMGQARSVGYRYAMNGRAISENPYLSPLMRSAFEKGYREYEQRLKLAKK